MPKTILKIAGGREVHLKENDKMALRAGQMVLSLVVLTTGGNEANRDIAMIREIGLRS